LTPGFPPNAIAGQFGKRLTGPKLLRRPVVVVIGQNAGEDVDDRRVALVRVEPDMAARRHGRATDPQLAVVDAVYFFRQIYRGEHRFLDPF
jgi:hypothetical protein